MSKVTMLELNDHILAAMESINKQNELMAGMLGRIEALEVALEGARAAYRDLRAQVQGTRVQGRVESTPRLPIGEWNAALNDIRAERGLSATAYVARADVLLRAKELREIDDIYTRDVEDQARHAREMVA